MSGTNHNNAAFAAITVTLVAIFMFAGCSKSPVEALSVESEPTVLSRVSGGSSGPDLAPVNLYSKTVISAKEGGRLELLDVVLDVPAGAVDNDTVFSIFIPDDAVFYNEFGTHGLIFERPVTVTMSYRDADLTDVTESTIRIAWLNPGTGEWQDVECEIDFVNKVVTAQLDHFSAYGLISDRFVRP